MIQRNNYLIVLCLFLFSIEAFSQKDSSISFSFSSFLKIVQQHHPIVKQADLLIDNANAYKQSVRGEFDPKLFYGFESKYYDEKNYYSIGNGGLQIPTWYGLDFKMGLEKNNGDYLNRQQITPNEGLFYSQISLPLLQGLIIDERRATLKKARIFQQMSDFEKIIAVNELLYNAGKSYWDWQLAFSNMKVIENALFIAQQRFNAVKRTAELGDRPFIDTIESMIQLQERTLSLQQAQYEYQTKSILLSNYLWTTDNVPLELNNTITPEYYAELNLIESEAFDKWGQNIDNIIESHPELKTIQFKLNQAEIDRNLKQDKLKPKLNLNYSPLYNNFNNIYGNFNNYKWGLTAGIPLFLRKERAEFRTAKIKIENIQLEAIQKRIGLVNKIKRKQIEYDNYKKQFNLYFSTVDNYRNLWTSEKKLFDSGESSLFMINSREMSYLNAQLKLNDIFIKTKNALLDLMYNLCQIDRSL